jgi:hypothetical protein
MNNKKIQIILTTQEACWVRDAFQAAALLYSEVKRDGSAQTHSRAKWCRAFASGLQSRIDEHLRTAQLEIER